MDMVRMVTTLAHVYAGRALKVDDEFDCEPQHVHVMEVLGRARKKDEQAPAQQYQTRDMQAAERKPRARRIWK